MRILHMITSVDLQGGGPAEAVRLLSRIHTGQGHIAEILTLDAPGSAALDGLDVKVHAFGPAMAGCQYARGVAGWLRQHAKEFDVAVVHGLWQYPLHAAYRSLTGRLPYFVYPHGMLDPYFNEAFQLKFLKKFIYWRLIGRLALDAAGALIFTTEEEMRRSARAFFPYRWHAIIAPLGVATAPANSAYETADQVWPELVGHPYLLFFGRLHPKKGCELLLRAFARIYAWARTPLPHRLVMAGPADEEYLKDLKKLAAELGISGRVLWTGMVTGRAKWALLRSAEAFVLPSHQENFAIAAVEAMSTATPVLLSDKVQIEGTVRQAEAGLIDEDTLEGTTRLLKRWKATASEQQQAMRRNARACYLAYYTAEEASAAVLRQIETRRRQLAAANVPPGLLGMTSKRITP